MRVRIVTATKKIVNRHTIEIGKGFQGMTGDVFIIIIFVFTQSGAGNSNFGLQLLQGQIFSDTNILQFFLGC